MPGQLLDAEEIGMSPPRLGLGIGGILKARIQDFRVDEIATKIKFDPRGRFTAAMISLTNWETNRFVNKLARILGISRNRIFFAGTKDKKAITKQLFIIDAPVYKVETVEITDVTITILGRTHQKIGFGNHRGNRFTVIVRGCADENGQPLDVESALERVHQRIDEMSQEYGTNKFPNWIGPQRFGKGRPVTSEVGRHVVAGNWKEAVMTYISMEGKKENEDVSIFRKMARDNGISQELADSAPQWLEFEARMVQHLLSQPDDWIGAFRKLPNNLQLMTVHALQSLVFNHLLKNRIQEGISISEPIDGDVVGRIDEKGQLDTASMVEVSERTMPRIARNCLLNRLAVSGILPGSNVMRSGKGRLDKEQAIIEELGLKDVNWIINDIPRLSTSGTRRSLSSIYSDLIVDEVPVVDLEALGTPWSDGPADGSIWHPEGACLRFRFNLSSGAYATTLMREFMQCPLDQL